MQAGFRVLGRVKHVMLSYNIRQTQHTRLELTTGSEAFRGHILNATLGSACCSRILRLFLTSLVAFGA